MGDETLPFANRPVFPLGIGTAGWGNSNPPIPLERLIDLIGLVLEQDQRMIFDTAPRYGFGYSEEMLGAGLRGVDRRRFLVSTKAGEMQLPDGSVKYAWVRDDIYRCVESSLERLKLDYIDIVHIHDPDGEHDPGWEELAKQVLAECLPALVDLRSQGVIKAIGAGLNSWETVDLLLDWGEFDGFLLAGRYTLLEQRSFNLLNRCHAQHIPLLLGGVFNSGILATGSIPAALHNYRPASPEILARVRRIEAICARYEVPLPAAALQFPLTHPAVKALAVGTLSRAELSANLAYLRHPIPAGFWDDLRAGGLVSACVPLPDNKMRERF